MKEITLNTLRGIVTKQDEWGYNRQVEPGILKEFQNGRSLHGQKLTFNVTMTHRHKRGEPCEPHYRTGLIAENALLAFIDMPIDYYESLASR